MAAFVVGSMFMSSTCNVQYPPSDTETVVGVAISEGNGVSNGP
jgi:hypothetical protein